MLGSWHGGKGSSRRKEDQAKIDANWDRIYNKMHVSIADDKIWTHTCGSIEMSMDKGEPCCWCGIEEDNTTSD